MDIDVCAHSINFSQRCQTSIHMRVTSCLRKVVLQPEYSYLSVSCSHLKAPSCEGVKCLLRSFSSRKISLSRGEFPQGLSVCYLTHGATHQCSNTCLYRWAHNSFYHSVKHLLNYPCQPSTWVWVIFFPLSPDWGSTTFPMNRCQASITHIDAF